MTPSKLSSKQPLQAVVLADSFARRLEPVTLTRPKALLPLANTPLLQYSLEFLAESGVQHVVVVCKAFAEDIEKFVASRQSTFRSEFRVETVLAAQCCSVGDALRHLDNLEMIKSDPFVLMGADTVAEIDLSAIVDRQRMMQNLDPQHITTVVFKRAARKHRLRNYVDDLFVVVAPDFGEKNSRVNDDNPEYFTNGRLLAYQNDRSSRFIETEIEDIMNHDSVFFCSDLLDTHIQVCSLEVLKIFSENFDMQTMDRDFFEHTFGNALGYRLGCHVVDTKYAARINCWNTYDAVSRDIVQRWAFRFSLDHNVFRNSSYSYQRLNVYKEKGVRMAQSSIAEENVVIAGGTCVGKETYLVQTIVGHNCAIGSNVKISGSYLWSGVTVEDDVVIDHALLCDGVIVRKGAVIGAGALLSYGVVVGAGVEVPPYTKLWTKESAFHTEDDEFDSCSDCADSRNELADSIGPDSVGIIFRAVEADSDDDDSEDDDDDQEDFSLDERSRKIRDLAKVSINSLVPDEAAIYWWEDFRFGKGARSPDDSEDESVLTFDSNVDETHVDELAEQADVEWNTEQEQMFRLRNLYTEVSGTIRRSIEQGITDKDALSLEVASLKFSDNASMATYSASVFLAMFDELRPRPEMGSPPGTAVLKSLGKQLRELRFLLDRYIHDVESEHRHVITGLEMACLFEGKPYKHLFKFALSALYQLDMLCDEGILEWASDRDSQSESPESELRRAASQLVDTLRESESEESTDNEDSDDE